MNKQFRIVVTSAALLAAVGSANAALSADITTAITGAGTDAAALGVAVLVVLVGIRAFKWLRKAL